MKKKINYYIRYSYFQSHIYYLIYLLLPIGTLIHNYANDEAYYLFNCYILEPIFFFFCSTIFRKKNKHQSFEK